MDGSAAPLLLPAGGPPENTAVAGEGEEGRWSSLWRETRLIFAIAGPCILTSLLEFSLGTVTQAFVGHIGTLELAAVGLQNLVIAGVSFGIMLGMGSALETICGQAYGAGKPGILGIYLQRSCVMLLLTALPLSLLYIFAAPILRMLGQSDEIAELAGKFSLWMLPELFAFAINFPVQKFLQAQSKVVAMTWVAAAGLVLHTALSWLFIAKLEMGLVGAAVTLNFSWLVTVGGQIWYVLSGSCRDSWTGFSWLAFTNLMEFFWLSLASAVMLCLEYWTLMVVILLAGLLKNPELAVDAASICMNIEGWCFMIPLGLVAAISVRVSNELGAGRPKAAKFSMLVVIAMSLIIQTTFVILILSTRKILPRLFTESPLVIEEVSRIAYFLCVSIFLSSIQPILSGVAVGAGWQASVAYVNLGCYYGVGLTLAAIAGFKLDFGLEGIWGGVLVGIFLQTLILIAMTWRTDWEREAELAASRVSNWEEGQKGEEGALLP